MQEQEGFSKYGKSFQESLALMILDDRPFCEQIEEVIDINFFELNYLKVFTRIIFDYKSRYGVHPTSDIMSSLLKTKIEDESEISQKQIRDFFTRSLEKEVDGQEYIKETSLDFCKKQKHTDLFFSVVSEFMISFAKAFLQISFS